MATEKQREKKLQEDIAASQKKLGGILSERKRAVTGAVAEFAGKKGFSTNASVRNSLYSELAKEYQTLNTNINKWTVDAVDDTAKQWWKYAGDDLPKGATSTFGAFSEKHIQDIIGRINPASVGGQVAVNAQIGGMLQNDIRTLRAAVSTTIAEGAVEGLTNKQLADRMNSKVIGAAGEFRFIDAAGRRQTADNYFGMLNRTLHATAARDSYIATGTDAGFDLYQIEGGVTGSSVDNPSDPCDQWAGRIISMTGSTKGYPTYQDAISAGVFHQNCLHFVRAIMPSEIKVAKVEQKKERIIATTIQTEAKDG